MKQSREWTVQVLDAEGNVKYQSSIFGTEKRARTLCQKLEAKRRKDRDTHGLETKARPKQAKNWF